MKQTRKELLRSINCDKADQGHCTEIIKEINAQRTKQYDCCGYGLGVVVFGRGPGLLQIRARIYCRAMRLDVHRAREVAKAAATACESSGET